MLLALLLHVANAADLDADGADEVVDCDDADPGRHPEALERCDAVDNDCDGAIDEPAPALTPDLDPTCAWHHLDQDDDGFGVAPEGPPSGLADRLCLCPLFERAVYDDGVVVIGDEPTTCPHVVDLDGARATAFGHVVDGFCYVSTAGDCDDLAPSVHPRLPDAEGTVVLDGVDDDCLGALTVLELDCDDDGALALPPTVPAAMRPNRGALAVDAATLGLASCVGAPAPDLDCWGAALPLTCDAPSGLWTVPRSALEAVGRFAGNARVPYAAPASGFDCDDACPLRREGLIEVCDGLDNDCGDAASALSADTDGIPDALQSGAIPGWVDESELDDDGDRVTACYDSDSFPSQTTATTQGCDALESNTPFVADIAMEVPRCGCQSVGDGTTLGLGVGALALRRRRRRAPAEGLVG